MPKRKSHQGKQSPQRKPLYQEKQLSHGKHLFASHQFLIGALAAGIVILLFISFSQRSSDNTGTRNIAGEAADIPGTSSCIDSDGGKHLGVAGVLTVVFPDGSVVPYADICTDPNTLYERSCADGVAAGHYTNCPNGCADGKCL